MADRFEVETLGQDALIRLIRDAAQGAPQVLGQALYEEAQLAFRRTQREVPVRKGYLKNSGRLSPPEANGNGDVSVAITYGSSAVKYAAPVHDLNKNYRKGRKWHYVSDPVLARVQGMESRLARRIDRITGGS